MERLNDRADYLYKCKSHGIISIEGHYKVSKMNFRGKYKGLKVSKK